MTRAEIATAFAFLALALLSVAQLASEGRPTEVYVGVDCPGIRVASNPDAPDLDDCARVEIHGL